MNSPTKSKHSRKRYTRPPEHLLSFSSEDLLQQAIASLLTKLPDTSGVQILQGSQEVGKDIVFYSKGALTEPILCACVVKNTKISGDVARPGGARTVLFQTEQAFDSAHTNSFGEDVKVERVYVITPYELPPTTMSSIRGKLKEKAGQVKFVGGPQLFDLFKAYWPDYFADEAAAIAKHLKKTKNIMVEESPLPALAFQYALGSVPKKSSNVYVSQEFQRIIYDYSTGTALSLHDEQILVKDVTREEIVRTQNHLIAFDEILEYLNDWGLIPSDYDTASLKHSREMFFRNVLDEWELSVKRERGGRPAPGQLVAVRLQKAGALAKNLRSQFNKRFRYLSILHKELKTLKEIITTGSFVTAKTLLPKDVLGNQDFLHACMLNDCARASPDKAFVQSNLTFEVGFPTNILDIWDSNLLIAGSPGYGKTSFCKWHTLQDAENLNTGKSSVLPIYIPLHTLARKPLGSFQETFLSTIGKSALVPVSRKNRPSRIRLYLDGLDEIASPERRREVVDLVRKSVQKNQKYQVVITSRDYVFGKWLEWLPKIYLSEFDDLQITKFLDKWLGEGTEVNKRFCLQLEAVPTIRALMRTPLLATLTVMVFKQTGRLPEGKNRLYEIFIDLLAGGWDIAKGINRGSKFGQKIKVLILTSLAGKQHAYRHREFSETALKAAIESSCSASMLGQWKSLQNELIADGILSQSGGVLHFNHLSFQEFLAARDLMGTPHHSRVLRAFELYLYGDNWWRDVLKFYIGLAASPQDITSWLVDHIQNIRRLRYQKVSTEQTLEILASVLEAFPEYPAREIARTAEQILDNKIVLSYLKKRIRQ